MQGHTNNINLMRKPRFLRWLRLTCYLNALKYLERHCAYFFHSNVLIITTFCNPLMDHRMCQTKQWSSFRWIRTISYSLWYRRVQRTRSIWKNCHASPIPLHQEPVCEHRCIGGHSPNRKGLSSGTDLTDSWGNRWTVILKTLSACTPYARDPL